MEMTYEKELEERRIIKQETRVSLMIGIACLIATIIYGLIARFVKIEIITDPKLRETVYGLLVLVIILIMIGILAARKTLYYSSRLIKDEFSLTQVLQKWRTIDIVLLATAEVIPIIGMVIAFTGMPFDRTWFIFLTSGILMIILIPMGIKVRSKLAILKKQNPNI
jgi:hypothetical protein